MAEYEDTFDPFKVFEVEKPKCLKLKIVVLRGRHITKGTFWDLIDWPDPYILVKVPASPEHRRWTHCCSNTNKPDWNETLEFCIDDTLDLGICIHLMEANYGPDSEIAHTHFDLKDLPLGKWIAKTFKFDKHGEVDINFFLNHTTDSALRFSLCLCQKEKLFLEQRKKHVLECLQTVMEDRAPTCLEEIPTIAVMGSGGGFRAMTGFSGAMKALEDTGILDCVTYTAALSGSSWFLSTLYSHPDWPEKSVREIQREIRERVRNSPMRLLSPRTMYHYLERVIEKRCQGQPVSFTDFFGLMVGETLLKSYNERLSDQAKKLRCGQLPMPICSGVHVKRDVSAVVFQEWVEFTPYEIGIPKYAVFMPSEMFGCKFFRGQVTHRFQEPPLHYLQGLWGSAFCVLFKQLMKKGDQKLEKNEDPEDFRLRKIREVNRENSMEEASQRNLRKQSIRTILHECEDITESIRMSAIKNIGSGTDPVDYIETDNFSESGEDSSDSENEFFELEETDDREKLITRKCTLPCSKKQFWTKIIEGVFHGNNILNDRSGRAAVVHNFMRGLSLNGTFPVSPFTPSVLGGKFAFTEHQGSTEYIDEVDEFDGLYDIGPQLHQKYMYMVDAGLSFNSPYPCLLRPQRGVDLIISFDFTGRESDDYPPFKTVLMAYKWALLHQAPFPQITLKEYNKDGLKELYIFRDENNPRIPILMHFVLVNKQFREFKRPGVRRETEEEFEFANFSIFDDPTSPYSTFNFTYDPLDFDRLSTLVEFNTLLHIGDIKDCIAECIDRRRQHVLTTPFSRTDIPILRLKKQNRERLEAFINLKETEHRLHVSSSFNQKRPIRNNDSASDIDSDSFADLPDSPDHLDDILESSASSSSGVPRSSIVKGRKETTV